MIAASWRSAQASSACRWGRYLESAGGFGQAFDQRRFQKSAQQLYLQSVRTVAMNISTTSRYPALIATRMSGSTRQRFEISFLAS